jgi:hypothetical protein
MTATTTTTTKRPNELPINIDEWQRLQNYIWQGLNDRGQRLNKIDVGAMMYGFSIKFDLAAMYRFFDWAQVNMQYQDDEILNTLIHDLNGRFEDPKMFDPRTSSY